MTQSLNPSRYYSDRLSAERLRRCYEVASPRVRQYLEAETRFVLERVTPASLVLEFGCGYGRALAKLANKARRVVGIDTSVASLRLAREDLHSAASCRLAAVDAVRLGFRNGTFQLVACIQNGISAFHVDRRALIEEAVRVTCPGGKVLFSSYSPRFWGDRLEWFRNQAARGLVGEIDEDATGDGVIVCTDGFTATTVSPDEFRVLTSELGLTCTITEVDNSSIFCEIVVS
jgi:2-polyprenyl-6-hydroxyphenyl methylase/3-demethylubiquinone-9 3-methyltransferase